ncbi:5'-methylthioadenosine/S-adenosylhomocysteine nucleosidase family protein [Streptomyces phaeofaciens]|uniref:5'-methylthioadenosine/S-adenosylhomocysteine nucleosidase family protein n=1 Tax=Streptomyces phaeofaciens TaxID=68254 RepID=UPI00369A8ADD
MTTDTQQPTVAILTALPLEYEAVKALLSDVEEIDHPDGTYADVGRIPGLPWRIALVRTGVGTLNAATATMRVDNWLRPQAAFFVGIAGGLKDDLELGAVVVASKVYGIHGGKLEDGRFQVRPEAWPVSYRLDQAAHKALGTTVEFKPIAVGDVVLADHESELAAFLRTNYGDAVAFEMEGTGFAHAAHVSDKLNAMIIRGVSDKADGGKAAAEQGGWQERAAANAAAAAIAVLGKLKPVDEGQARDERRTAVADAKNRYGGDHIELKGTFHAPVIGKMVDNRGGNEPVR